MHEPGVNWIDLVAGALTVVGIVLLIFGRQIGRGVA